MFPNLFLLSEVLVLPRPGRVRDVLHGRHQRYRTGVQLPEQRVGSLLRGARNIRNRVLLGLGSALDQGRRFRDTRPDRSVAQQIGAGDLGRLVHGLFDLSQLLLVPQVHLRLGPDQTVQFQDFLAQPIGWLGQVQLGQFVDRFRLQGLLYILVHYVAQRLWDQAEVGLGLQDLARLLGPGDLALRLGLLLAQGLWTYLLGAFCLELGLQGLRLGRLDLYFAVVAEGRGAVRVLGARGREPRRAGGALGNGRRGFPAVLGLVLVVGEDVEFAEDRVLGLGLGRVCHRLRGAQAGWTADGGRSGAEIKRGRLIMSDLAPLL